VPSPPLAAQAAQRVRRDPELIGDLGDRLGGELERGCFNATITIGG